MRATFDKLYEVFSKILVWPALVFGPNSGSPSDLPITMLLMIAGVVFWLVVIAASFSAFTTWLLVK